jgi:hypothetical protein
VTWNDFGEGTNIEPTEEYGYRYLEIIQDLKRNIDPRFSYRNADLMLPRQLYDLRKKYRNDKEVMSKLDEVFTLLLSGELSGAKKMMAELCSSS